MEMEKGSIRAALYSLASEEFRGNHPTAAYFPATMQKSLPVPLFQVPGVKVRYIQDGHINHITHM